MASPIPASLFNVGPRARPVGEPETFNTYDFVDREAGKAIPYGVFDVARNRGWVSVGVDHDSAAFAVAALRSWWWAERVGAYPGAAPAPTATGYRSGQPDPDRSDGLQPPLPTGTRSFVLVRFPRDLQRTGAIRSAGRRDTRRGSGAGCRRKADPSSILERRGRDGATNGSRSGSGMAGLPEREVLDRITDEVARPWRPVGPSQTTSGRGPIQSSLERGALVLSWTGPRARVPGGRRAGSPRRVPGGRTGGR